MSFDGPTQCVICSASCVTEWRNAKIEVFKCRACGHRLARHAQVSQTLSDYHQQYKQAEFVESLKITRIRQAQEILATARQLYPENVGHWLDFGCGRGWFLNLLKQNGEAPLAGADTSSLALQWLRESGIDAFEILVERGHSLLEEKALLFYPKHISFLDVLEHFPVDSLMANAKLLFHVSPDLQSVVVKVPVSDGILFKLANMAHRLGYSKLLEQLYQVGTHPPHVHYFSRRSLQRFIEASGCRIETVLDDPDFDGLVDRIQFLSGVPGWLKRPVDQAIFAFCKFFGCDCRIVFARV